MLDFAGVRVLVLGDVMLDRFLYGEVDRISPEAPVPVVRLRRSHAMPGGAGNVARNVSALGGKAVLVGLLGEDDAAAELRALLAGRPGHRGRHCGQRRPPQHPQDAGHRRQPAGRAAGRGGGAAGRRTGSRGAGGGGAEPRGRLRGADPVGLRQGRADAGGGRGRRRGGARGGHPGLRRSEERRFQPLPRRRLPHPQRPRARARDAPADRHGSRGGGRRPRRDARGRIAGPALHPRRARHGAGAGGGRPCERGGGSARGVRRLRRRGHGDRHPGPRARRRPAARGGHADRQRRRRHRGGQARHGDGGRGGAGARAPPRRRRRWRVPEGCRGARPGRGACGGWRSGARMACAWASPMAASTSCTPGTFRCCMRRGGAATGWWSASTRTSPWRG